MRYEHILRSIRGRPNTLFHTTSYEAIDKILESNTLIPGNGGFVSFSEKPIIGGDIQGNDVVIEVKTPPQVMKVEYNKQWFNKYPEIAAYIAGEGWQEQFEYSEDSMTEDEEGEFWPDEDLEYEEYMEAMYQAFVAKKSEEEWVSIEENEDIPIEIVSVSEINI